MTQSRETYKYWVETILAEAEDKLTDWERNFITDIAERLDKFSGYLTEAQAKTLERIYAEKTA